MLKNMKGCGIMRKIYHVEIEEILQNVYDIEANSYEEAEEIARERYRNEEYILEAETLKETNFREFGVPTKVKEKEFER